MAGFRLFDLNDAQRQAVTQTDGPVLILAGAGTGKTRVITARIAYLLAQGVAPEAILAVTFTNKAAQEMRERVATMVQPPEAARKLTLATFHALCVRLLRADIERLGYKHNFSIYDQGDSLGLIRQVIHRTAGPDEKLEPSLAQAMISKAKNHAFAAPPPPAGSTAADGADPDASAARFEALLPASAADSSPSLLAEVSARYQRELKRLNAVDFDDLLRLAVRLLGEHAEVRARWRQRYRHVMIDEFQDTNRMQLELARLLVDPAAPNVCVVGDDDQSIYSWRGAELSNILEFERHFPAPTVVKLEQNYRSTNAILGTANSLIRHNPRRRPKQLWSERGEGEKVRLVPAPHEEEEATFVVSDLHRRRAGGELARWADCAVLFRINAQARPLEEQFRRLQIPYRIVGSRSFYDRREVKDLLAYLSCLLNPDDDVSLLRIVNVPARGLGETTVERALQHSIARQGSLYAAFREEEFLATLTARPRAAFRAFAELLDEYETKVLAPRADLAGTVSALLAEIGYLADLRRSCATEQEGLGRETSVRELIADLARYQERRPDAGLRGFLDELSLDQDRAERRERDRKEGKEGEEPPDQVTLITLHAAKGLEFPHVYLVGLEEGILPHERSRLEGSLDEERRLLYVGITRAMRTVTLSYCLHRKKYGSLEPRRPSTFLRELAPERLETVDLHRLLQAPATTQSARSHFSRMRELLQGT